MIVDTSVLVAILFQEDEGRSFRETLLRASNVSMSAGNWLELQIVLVRRRMPELLAAASQLLKVLNVRVMAVTPEQASIARDAYLQFGKGTGHPAKLNFGDCFAYALAKATGEPLLFKGDDFSQTDIMSAL